jgi:hypothetical protein
VSLNSSQISSPLVFSVSSCDRNSAISFSRLAFTAVLDSKSLA